MTLTSILAGSAAVIAILVAGSYLLPRHIEVTRTATLPVKPEAVMALAASNIGYQRFNPYLSADPALKIEAFGPETGVGSGFRFDGKDGKGTQTVAEVTPGSVTYAIDLGAMGTPTQRLAVEAAGDGARVIWSLRADMGMNPVFRVFGLFMDRMIGKTFEQGLRNIKTAAAA
ncbi:SRPBCC family protein [uncultured Hoeflea sp.]|uniref:SRPBCC family protein n=1 Tax=uncultured Hoeflea sp. TaxID=538666 RepID=UPI002622B4DB|nr:SRPBCC family protein [uncultured Hoeflea sp.]